MIEKKTRQGKSPVLKLNHVDPPQAERAGEKKKKKSTAELLVRLATESGVKFFHTPDSAAYAIVPVDGHQMTAKIRSQFFSSWLKRSYYRATRGKTPGAQAVADALGVLEGIALHDCPTESVHLRTAEKDGRIYLDLADDRWRAVEVDRAGWRIVDRPPVRFRRPRAMLPLPEPKRGGCLDQLWPVLNLSADEDWRLAVAWLLAALRPAGPYPLLVLSGQQGSAKSTTARVLRSLIDPNVAPIRCEPKEPRDLMIAANGSRLLALDNLSAVPVWLSDALCRLSTGGGFSTRQLYSDDEEIIFDSQRPVILTSIEDVATRGDLLERSLILSLPPIPERQRLTEEEMKAKFDPVYPFIFGALLDALAGAIRELPGVKLPAMPRMADFAVFATAGERGLGWPSGSFLRAYGTNRADANAISLDSSPLSAPIQQLLTNAPEWTGTAAELLEALQGHVGEQAARARDWPKNGQVLSGKLKRLAPNLRAAGIALDIGGREGSSRRRIIHLMQEKVRENTVTPSAPSAADASSEGKTTCGTNAADAQADARGTADALSVRTDGQRTHPGEESVRTQVAENSALTASADGATAFSRHRSSPAYLAPGVKQEDARTPFDD